MALNFIDKLKKVNLTKADDMISTVINAIQSKTDSLNTSEQEDKKTEIDSIGSLSGYIQSLQLDASPSVMMVSS